MFYLYVLQSKNGRHYIGITADLEKRLIKHNNGGVRSTKSYRPWQVIYREGVIDKISARKREIFLKRTAKAREDLFRDSGAIV